MFDRLFDFLFRFIELFRCFTVINEYERGIVLRLGKYNRELDKGFHWLLPLAIEEALSENVVITTINLNSQSLTDRDWETSE